MGDGVACRNAQRNQCVVVDQRLGRQPDDDLAVAREQHVADDASERRDGEGLTGILKLDYGFGPL
jgi:hypothetical protein